MIEFSIDSPNRLIRTVASGEISFVQIMKHINNMSKHPDFDPTFDSFVTVKEDARADITPQKEEFKRFYENYQNFREGAKWAIVLPDQMTNIKVRKAFENVKLNKVQLRLFMSEQEAIAWLGH